MLVHITYCPQCRCSHEPNKHRGHITAPDKVAPSVKRKDAWPSVDAGRTTDAPAVVAEAVADVHKTKKADRRRAKVGEKPTSEIGEGGIAQFPSHPDCLQCRERKRRNSLAVREYRKRQREIK